MRASEEAYSATFTLALIITFEVLDLEEQYYFRGSGRFHGLGNRVFPGNIDTVVRGTVGEAAEFAEFNIGSFSFPPNTVISSAIF